MNNYEELLGMDVYGNDDEKIGTIDTLYVTDGGEDPIFATVKTGWFSGSSFFPLQDAQMTDDRVVIPYTKDLVKDAPNVERDNELSREEEERLYAHYHMSRGGHVSDDVDDDLGGDNGHDTSGPTTDDAMTRSEEVLNVGTRTEETGRYRLRKYVVTENVTKIVPVEREEVHLEREPITDDNRDAAMSGPEISDEEHEVVTHAEVPVVGKETVPQERVKLNKEVVRDEKTVSEDVHKERIDVDEDER